jgi:dCMP deaminase
MNQASVPYGIFVAACPAELRDRTLQLVNFIQQLPRVLVVFTKQISSTHMSARKDYLTWDEYFMGVALLSGRRSKDPNTQVGACIVNSQQKIVGAGYNGLPIGCNDEDFPWEKTGDFLNTKYPYVCHAELNAILNNIGMNLSGCRIYTALFPCNECSKAIIQSGIKEVIFLSDKYDGTDVSIASKKMLDTAGVTYRKVQVNRETIELSFDEKKV